MCWKSLDVSELDNVESLHKNKKSIIYHNNKRRCFILVLVASLTSLVLLCTYLGVASYFPVSNGENVDYSENGEVGSIAINIDKAHVKGIKHRGVWLFVIDEIKQSILFTKRSSNHVTCPDSWGTVGEHCAPGEDYNTTLLRGLREELSITSKDIARIERITGPDLFSLNYPKIKRKDRQFMSVYMVILRPNFKIISSQEESAYRWIPLSSAIEWISHCDITTGIKKCRCCMDSDTTNIFTVTQTAGVRTNFTSFADMHAHFIKKVLKRHQEIYPHIRLL